MKKRIVLPLAAVLAVAGLAVPAAAAQAAVCTQTSSTGACGPYTDPGVFTSSNGADLVVQNDFSSIPQTLTASGDSGWTVAADASAQGDQGSVKSYPATQVTYTLPSGKPDPSSGFGATLASSYTDINPAGTGQGYEYAFDDWLADPAKPSWANDLEVMIWTDTYGAATQPAGSDSGQVYTDAAGVQWEVWVAGGATTVSPDSTVSFVRKTNAPTGSIDRMGFYGYLQSHGMLASVYGIDQLNYGLEIRSTGTGQKTYGITGYTISPNGRQQAPTGPVISGFNTKKCVDVTGNSSANGTKVQLWDCLNDHAQQWTVNLNGTLTVNGKCLDVTGQGTANGTGVELYACNGGANQQWKPVNGSLVSAQSGKCLDDPGWNVTDGTPLDIWTCLGGSSPQSNELWKLP